MGKPEKMFQSASSGVECALTQCEIISGLQVHQIDVETVAVDTEGLPEQQPRIVKANSIKHPYAIVVSQDCDLTQDYNFRFKSIGKPRNAISNILFCEAMLAEDLVHGDEHGTIFEEGAIRQDYRNNNDFRYHFIQEIPMNFDALGCGIGELGFVFKRFFSLPSQEAYDQIRLGLATRRTVLKRPYLEHFCDRSTITTTASHYLNNTKAPNLDNALV